jgi:hypothetical protein
MPVIAAPYREAQHQKISDLPPGRDHTASLSRRHQHFQAPRAKLLPAIQHLDREQE